MTIAKSLYFGRNRHKKGYRHRVHRAKKNRKFFEDAHFFRRQKAAKRAKWNRGRLTPAEKKRIYDQITHTRAVPGAINKRALPKADGRARVEPMPDYKLIAKNARLKVLDMIFRAQSSHIGSNFSSIDILSVLFEKMNLEEDELIVSKGWIAASVYYFLAEKGVIPKEDLERYCLEGEQEYIGLVEPRGKFGLRAAGGSMGFGLPFAVGFALEKKLRGKPGTVYCLMSDGEQAIGTTWEAALLAASLKLNNLVVIIDNNGFQAMGETQEILPVEFPHYIDGWYHESIAGHNHALIEKILGLVPHCKGPFVIDAHTTKGKGVRRFEDNNLYHYKNLSDDEYNEAVADLNAGFSSKKSVPELP